MIAGRDDASEGLIIRGRCITSEVLGPLSHVILISSSATDSFLWISGCAYARWHLDSLLSPPSSVHLCHTTTDARLNIQRCLHDAAWLMKDKSRKYVIVPSLRLLTEAARSRVWLEIFDSCLSIGTTWNWSQPDMHSRYQSGREDSCKGIEVLYRTLREVFGESAKANQCNTCMLYYLPYIVLINFPLYSRLSLYTQDLKASCAYVWLVSTAYALCRLDCATDYVWKANISVWNEQS